MKQTTFTLLLSVLLSMVGLQAFANFDTSTKIQVDDLYYYLDKDNSQAQVTSMPSGKYTGNIVIPSSITHETKTYSVTSIGKGAFYYCSGLASITIPNSVTSIGDRAFSECKGLTSIVVESGNTKYDSRENCNAIIETASNTLLNGCKNTVIPNSVTTIGVEAFYGCSGLTTVTIPNSVTRIGDDAFRDCSGLTSIVVESGNTTYDSRENCNVIIETASNTLLYGCKNTVIPNSVTSIGNYAFNYCSGLASITIPNSVTSISGRAFSGCSGLSSIVVESGNTTYDSRENCNAIIETASNTLVAGCKTTTIPNSVTSIGDYAFYNCSGLTSITIGSNVTSIGDYAFYNCSGLKDVYCYPTEVPETGSDAFLYVTRSNVTLHVPFFSLIKYKEHEVWGKFKFGSYLGGVSFTYSVDGLSKLKMDVFPFDHNLNITAEEGWKVNALTVNGEDMMSSLTDNVLTINITADTEVKVTLGWANEANLYTEDPATGIATIEGEGVKVQAKDGQIWVDGAAGKTVRLYTIGGALMTTVTPTAGNTGKFSVAPGTYIIQVGNKAAKVTVK